MFEKNRETFVCTFQSEHDDNHFFRELIHQETLEGQHR